MACQSPGRCLTSAFQRRLAGLSDGSRRLVSGHCRRGASPVAVAELMRRIWMMTRVVGVRGSPMALAALLFFLSGLGPARAVAPASKLNAVLILADDFGWTDLACYGSKLYETPHIDRLARDGMKFTQAYAACCVCSPTRAAILTGRPENIPRGCTSPIGFPVCRRKIPNSSCRIGQNTCHLERFPSVALSNRWIMPRPASASGTSATKPTSQTNMASI